MKPQDIAFIVVLIGLLVLRKPRVCVAVGLVCFILAMPLFQFWIFFTAQRLVMYGAAFILVGVVMMLAKTDKKNK